MRFRNTPILDSKLLGSRIRQARERLSISQEDFATLASKDQRAISEFENGKRKLSAVDLLSFAKILKVPLLYFYEGEISTQDLDHVLLSEFHKLPTSETKEAAIEIVRILYNLHASSSSG